MRLLVSLVLLGALPAAAAPPVDVGPVMHLDRPGDVAYGGRVPCASGNGHGLFALCWFTSTGAVYARVYDVAGAPRTAVVEVTRRASGAEAAIDLGVDGGFFVAWPEAVAGGDPTLRGRRFRPDGTPDGPEVALAPAGIGGAIHGTFAVGLGEDGTVAAAWQSRRSTTHARLVVRTFDRAGAPRGPEHTVSEPADRGPFAGMAFAMRGESVVIGYGRPRFDAQAASSISDLAIRRLDRTGAPTSDEIEAGLPRLPTVAYVARGLALFPDGRVSVAYQSCDPLHMSGVCEAALTLAIGADDVPGAPDTLGPVQAPALASGPRADALSNLATFVVDSQRTGRLAVRNPLGALVATAAVPPPPPSGSGAVLSFAAFVPVGIGRFGVVWEDGDWSYLQPLTVGGETVAAPYFNTLAPCRLVDTRATASPLLAANDAAFETAGRCALPVGAKALAANVTSVASTAAGAVRLYRSDGLVSPTSVLNYSPGQTRAAFTLLPLGADGRFAVRVSQNEGTTHLIVDVSGYFE
jgi:hypothetical protein